MLVSGHSLRGAIVGVIGAGVVRQGIATFPRQHEPTAEPEPDRIREQASQDGDENPPDAWTEFRDGIKAADAVLFVTPEHNRSIPAALKNALDIGSRPHGKNVWSGKPGAVVSASPGGIGGFGANHHLRQSLVFLNVPAMAQPEAYIGGADKLFDANGKLANDGTRKFLQGFVQAYSVWITANAKS